MSAKLKIVWVSDSSGTLSCHVNGPGKLKETYLGHVLYKDEQWFSKVKGEEELRGPHKSMFFAKRDVEKAVDGEPV